MGLTSRVGGVVVVACFGRCGSRSWRLNEKGKVSNIRSTNSASDALIRNVSAPGAATIRVPSRAGCCHSIRPQEHKAY